MTVPGRAALTGATGRVRSRSPDKASAPLSGKLSVITFKPVFSIWPASPGRVALTGATGRMRSRGPDKAFTPLSGKLSVITFKAVFSIWPASPDRAALTGATKRMRPRSPDKAVTPLSGSPAAGQSAQSLSSSFFTSLPSWLFLLRSTQSFRRCFASSCSCLRRVWSTCRL